MKAEPTIEIPPVLLAVAVIASVYEWAVFASTFSHPGTIGPNLNAPGGDWIAFYGAARAFLDGHPDLIFDGNRLTGFLNSAFSWWLSKPLEFRPWVYPPSYLLLVLPFGALPFVASYLIFQLFTAGLLAAALGLGPDRRNAKFLVAVSVLLSPAAAFNVVGGQNAFLISALAVAGFRVIRRDPLAAGALLGVLTVKPQFCLLIPIALIAAREWWVLVSTVMSGTALVLISIPVVGIDLWVQWLRLATDIYAVGDAKWIEYGRIWGISVYACVAAAGDSKNPGQCRASGCRIGYGRSYLPGFPSSVDRQQQAGRPARRDGARGAPRVPVRRRSARHSRDVLDKRARNGDRSPLKWPLALSFWLAPLFNPPLVSPVARFTPALIVAFIVLIIGRRAEYEDGAAYPVSIARDASIFDR